MKRYIIISIVVFFAMFILSVIVHGFILHPFNKDLLVGIVSESAERNYLAITINYLALSIGLSVLIVKINKDKSYKLAGLVGAIVGSLLFLNYGLSNMFILPEWPLLVVITDTMGVAVIFTILGLLITFLDTKIK